jgi:hypothetical protein
MAPKLGVATGAVLDPTKEKWVNVTWMPHTTLSQTSHVCLTIRSAHASLDLLHNNRFDYDSHHQPEWKVRIGVYGIAGLLLVPVYSHTTAAPVYSRKRSTQEPALASDSNISNQEGEPGLRATVSNATHDCWWDCSVQMPIRWRDLPRDAYLGFEVLGQADIVVRGKSIVHVNFESGM